MRPFSWRKKWKMVWDDVRYCFAKCSNTRKFTKNDSRFFSPQPR
ncbi:MULTISPECIES: DUF2256 domain-containing protein [Pacificibacter]|nr:MULTISPECIES: DUF2256 domain-containing protein [Pacificibacter]MBU2935178.1 DUF2256 domain-containing protein [Pacificibacter marinus]MDO6615970.1 DUF2256 domain-containing protein [Pacificibacter sp. 1_MG-2023]